MDVKKEAVGIIATILLVIPLAGGGFWIVKSLTSNPAASKTDENRTFLARNHSSNSLTNTQKTLSIAFLDQDEVEKMVLEDEAELVDDGDEYMINTDMNKAGGESAVSWSSENQTESGGSTVTKSSGSNNRSIGNQTRTESKSEKKDSEDKVDKQDNKKNTDHMDKSKEQDDNATDKDNNQGNVKPEQGNNKEEDSGNGSDGNSSAEEPSKEPGKDEVKDGGEMKD
ncbi:hypothetical protein GCM10011409_14140 [Lentibacillus populi]|uniref:Uncharacterized protein n=1 Tax=Lentibacillus populi TaxID=1827502 RepID=A0A9W5TW44_9BACI|nr:MULTISPECIES: hypothetical protein [Bacillaceae]MBT2218214.1 hypothetical protein [Virgibacillus dakarensis]GGB37810.1 hypothetical protein GCM10011409_14140 [Lentibacillus populi]